MAKKKITGKKTTKTTSSSSKPEVIYRLTAEEEKTNAENVKLSNEALFNQTIESQDSSATATHTYVMSCLEVRRRLFLNEDHRASAVKTVVGGVTTWKAFREKHLRNPGESNSALQKRIQRLLVGLTPATKYQNRFAGTKKPKPTLGTKTAAEIVSAAKAKEDNQTDADRQKKINDAVQRGRDLGVAETTKSATDLVAARDKTIKSQKEAASKSQAEIDRLKKNVETLKAEAKKPVVTPAVTPPGTPIAPVTPPADTVSRVALILNTPPCAITVEDAADFVLDAAAKQTAVLSQAFIEAVITRLKKLSK